MQNQCSLQGNTLSFLLSSSMLKSKAASVHVSPMEMCAWAHLSLCGLVPSLGVQIMVGAL